MTQSNVLHSAQTDRPGMYAEILQIHSYFI